MKICTHLSAIADAGDRAHCYIFNIIAERQQILIIYMGTYFIAQQLKPLL
ncbi:hypothetical protein [Microcoleus sp. Pol12B4]